MVALALKGKMRIWSGFRVWLDSFTLSVYVTWNELESLILAQNERWRQA